MSKKDQIFSSGSKFATPRYNYLVSEMNQWTIKLIKITEATKSSVSSF